MSTHLLDEEQYIEDGYIDTSYFGGLIDGQIQATGYFEDDYIDQSYYSLAGMQFSLTASLTPAIVDGSAALSTSFALSATVENVLYGNASISCVTTVSTDISVTRSFSINASSTASLSTTETYLVSLPAANLPIELSSAFSVSVDAARTRSDDASITTNALLSIDIIRIQDASSTLQTETTVSSTISRTRGIETDITSTVGVAATPYRIIEAGADIDSVMASTLTVTVFKNHDAAMDSAFTKSADINFISDTGGLLEYFADLDAQAARTRGIDAGLSSAFFTSDSSGSLSNDIDASVTVDAASILTATSSLSVSVVTVELAEADLTAEFDISADALEFRSKWVNTNRPIGSTFYAFNSGSPAFTSTSYSFNSSSKKEGTHSFEIDDLRNLSDDAYFLEIDPLATTAQNNNYLSGESWTLDFWFYRDTYQDADHILLLEIATGTGSPSTGFNGLTVQPPFYPSSGRLQLYIDTAGVYGQLNGNIYYPGPSNAGWKSLLPNTNQSQYSNLVQGWNYVSLIYNHSTPDIRLYLNKSYLTGSSLLDRYVAKQNYEFDYLFSGTGTKIRLYQPRYNLPASSNTDSATIKFDSLRLKRGFPGQLDYSYPQNVVNTEDTELFLTFNNTLADNLATTLDAQSDLETVINVNAVADKIVESNANLQTTTSITSIIGSVIQANIDLDATGSQLAAIGVIGSFFVNADVAANISTDAARFRTVDADLSSVVSATIDAGKTTNTSANFTGAFTPTLTANVIRNDEIDLVTTTTLSATPTRIQPGASDLDTTVSMNTDGFSIIDIDADITSAFTQADTDFIRYRDADIDLDATGSQLVAIAKTAGFFINSDISTNLSATGVVKTGTVVEDVILSTALGCDIDLFKGFNSNLNSAYTATASGVLVTGADATITSAFSTETDAARTRGIETDFDSIATQLSVIGKIMPYTAGLDSAFAMTATPVKTTDVDADIEFAASITPLITRAKPLAADLTSTTALTGTLNKTTTFSSNITGTATLTATGAIKVFNLEQYYYTIPAETRSHTIAGETRSHSIARETRTYTLEGT